MQKQKLYLIIGIPFLALAIVFNVWNYQQTNQSKAEFEVAVKNMQANYQLQQFNTQFGAKTIIGYQRMEVPVVYWSNDNQTHGAVYLGGTWLEVPQALIQETKAQE